MMLLSNDDDEDDDIDHLMISKQKTLSLYEPIIYVWHLKKSKEIFSEWNTKKREKYFLFEKKRERKKLAFQISF